MMTDASVARIRIRAKAFAFDQYGPGWHRGPFLYFSRFYFSILVARDSGRVSL